MSGQAQTSYEEVDMDDRASMGTHYSATATVRTIAAAGKTTLKIHNVVDGTSTTERSSFTITLSDVIIDSTPEEIRNRLRALGKSSSRHTTLEWQ